MSALDDVLVVTVRKSFWASTEAERWPRRLYARVYRGHSSELVNALPVFVRALVSIWLRPPGIVLVGSVERTVPWFIRARPLGLLRGASLVVTNQLNLTPGQLEHVDRVIVYASAQAAALGDKGVFLPLPADGDLEVARRAAVPGDYVFSGGGAGRDFASLVEALRGTDARVEIVTFRPDSVAALQHAARVRGPLSQAEFLEIMAGALVVVVPLESAEAPHGQTTLVQALALGKPVVATRSVGVVDYVDGEDGSLVEAGDVAGLRRSLLGVLGDPGLRERLAARARARNRMLSYPHHAEGLAAVCRALADLRRLSEAADELAQKGAHSGRRRRGRRPALADRAVIVEQQLGVVELLHAQSELGYAVVADENVPVVRVGVHAQQLELGGHSVPLQDHVE